MTGLIPMPGWLTGALAVLCFSTAIAPLVVKVCASNLRPRVGGFWIALAASMVAIHVSATKPGGDRSAPPHREVFPISPIAVDFPFPGQIEASNLMFAAVSPTTNSIVLGLAWPENLFLTNGLIDIYGNWRLSTNGWTCLASLDISTAASNAVAELPMSSFPTNAMLETAFFRAASQDDTDGDGLPDALESWSAGTDPQSADSDGDGLPDGWEYSHGLNPLSSSGPDGPSGDPDGDRLANSAELAIGTAPDASDTDQDGVSDCDEIGGMTVYNHFDGSFFGNIVTNLTGALLSGAGRCADFDLPAAAVLSGGAFGRVTVDLNGIAYLRSTNDNSAVYCNSACADIAQAWFPDSLYVLAPYWAALGFSTNAPASSVAIRREQGICCVEWSNMRLLESSAPEENLVTVQAILPSANRPFAGFIYHLSGSETDGRHASIGVCSAGGGYRFFRGFKTAGIASDRQLVEIYPGIGTDPLSADTDLDGLDDGQELAIETNPLQPDSDGDGMNDGWEYRFRDSGFDPSVHNAADANLDNDIGADPDGDGLTNGQECEWGTNPSGLDQDWDGRPDGYDTDGDGVNDGAEIAQMSDPADASDGGVPDTRVPVPFYFGDPSGSHSEKYRLTVTPVSGSGDTPKSYSWLNENYGECETKTAMLKAGWKYEVRLYHAGTNGSGSGYPDYDYTLQPVSEGLSPRVAFSDPDGLFGVDGTSDSFAAAGKVAAVCVHGVTGVAICKPGESSWAELEESRVVLDDEELRIKITIKPQIQSLAQCRQMFGNAIVIKTAGTCPSGALVPIGEDTMLVNMSGRSEMRISRTFAQLRQLGLLPLANEDGRYEMAAYDTGTPAGSGGSNLTDSQAFLELDFWPRGFATGALPENGLELEPPISHRSESFFKAAGCEIVCAEYGGYTSPKRQIMNQADFFYVSGHGVHRFGEIDGHEPQSVSGRWNKDLNCIIFAGCSVLDVNDFNNNYAYSAVEHAASPGKLWEAAGPGILLGYNYIAPGDAGGAPARIIRSWVDNRAYAGDVGAWMQANADNRAWNACAIVKGQKYVHFTRKWFSHTIEEKPKGDW